MIYNFLHDNDDFTDSNSLFYVATIPPNCSFLLP